MKNNSKRKYPPPKIPGGFVLEEVKSDTDLDCGEKVNYDTVEVEVDSLVEDDVNDFIDIVDVCNSNTQTTAKKIFSFHRSVSNENLNESSNTIEHLVREASPGINATSTLYSSKHNMDLSGNALDGEPEEMGELEDEEHEHEDAEEDHPDDESPGEVNEELEIEGGEEYGPFDIAHFDFDHLTKKKGKELEHNQREYKRICTWTNMIPNGVLLRSLTTSSVALRGQQLGPRGIKALCLALNTNCTVTDLEISEDVIDVKTMFSLCEMFAENESINQIDLSDNRMGRLPVKILLENLLTIERCVSLSLSGNDLNDTDGDIFVNYITGTKFLTDLDLSYNNFSKEAGKVLGAAFAANTSLETLSVRWNQLNYKGAMDFIAGVGKSSSLTFLDLAWNGLGDEGVRSLCRMIRKNDVIEELDISSNRINIQGLIDFLTAVKSNKSLRNLNIGDNILSSVDTHKLLSHLLEGKAEMCLKNLSLGRQTIRMSTVGLVNSLLDDKDVMVTHGPVYGLKQKTDAEELASLNPVTLLLEFGRMLKMTIEELFVYIDADGGGTLSRDEIREGLMEFDIPLPERSLDILIRKMDSDGDGEIALSDLQTANSQEDKCRIKGKMMRRTAPPASVETERIRCRKILLRLLADNEKKKQNTKSMSKIETQEEMADEQSFPSSECLDSDVIESGAQDGENLKS